MAFNWSPSRAELCFQTLSEESGFLCSWELVQTAQISPRTEGRIPHHPSSLPSELFSKRQHKLIMTLLGILLSPNYSISGWVVMLGNPTWQS